MTDSLPVAAEVKVYETEKGPHISFTEQSVILNHGDKLVRKSDVKALIQEAREDIKKNNYGAGNVIKNLEELLEELEQ